MQNSININWEKVQGLIPAIIQDEETKEVLMLGFMNKEALRLSLETNFTHFFSRTKQRIWKKGESSGHTQEIKKILLDCDNDTLLVFVKQKGYVCHTGHETCFFTDITNNRAKIEQDKQELKSIDTSKIYGIIDRLYHTIETKKHGDAKKSYSAKLLQGKENSMLKKIAEEASEFCLAIKDKDEKEIIYEGADLCYHVLVGLCSQNISPDRIKQELASRFGMGGLEEKANRKE